MADQTEVTKRSADRRLQRVLAVYNRVDGAIFAVEAAVVSAATALMTLFIFLDLTFTFANGVRVRLFTEAGRADGLERGRLIALVLAVLLVVALVIAGVRAHPGLSKRGLGARVGAAATVLLGAAVLIGLLVHAHARVTCLTLVVLGALYALMLIRRRRRLGGASGRAFAIWALATFFLVWFAATVPDRYSSWAQPYALFLLLWTGFIGASMATSRGRHLKIDAVRKTLPRSVLGHYNLVSYLVAATFTAIFCYLAVRYTLARFDNVHAAGEVPDWLKVLAIPVSLFLISLRFTARAILSALGHMEDLSDEVIKAAADVEGAP